MTRRTFLQSVIALPLVAVGLPRVAVPAAFSPAAVSGHAWSIMRERVYDRETGISMRFIRSWPPSARILEA